MDKSKSQELILPEELEILEVEDSLESKEEDIVTAGEVETWKSLEALEKAKIRPYIAGTVVVLWAISIMVGLVVLIMKENPILLIGPSSVLTVTLHKVLKYYFANS